MFFYKLQQYLPLAVLKREEWDDFVRRISRCCNSTYRLRYWNNYSLSPPSMNPCCNSTYRLRYWNEIKMKKNEKLVLKLQQYLPLAVLKHWGRSLCPVGENTDCCNSTYRLRYWNSRYNCLSCRIRDTMHVATVLTACGIETLSVVDAVFSSAFVATVLTACGIETGRG